MLRDLGGADRRDLDPVPTAPRPAVRPSAPPRRKALPGRAAKLAEDEVVSLVNDEEAYEDALLALSVDDLEVPAPPGAVDVALALGELGTASAIAQVARALALTPLTAGDLGDALGRFAKHLSQTTGQLLALPGFGEALLAFGGVAGVVAGATGLVQELKGLPAGGPDAPGVLAIAARAAQLIGGVATALSPLCPALAPVGAALMTAGAAFALGRLAADQREALGGAVRLLSNNGGSIMPVISDNGGSLIPIIGDNGAGAPADQGGWVAT